MAKPNDMNKLRAKIIVKAWKDPRFKQLLLKNPKAAFKEMGVEVPQGFNIQVVEDKQSSYTFVLPAPASQIEEMSDAELENVAGGGFLSIGDCGTGFKCIKPTGIPNVC